MYCPVLLCIALYYCILVCITVFSVYYYVLFCISVFVLYCTVLLFIGSGKLAVYDSIAGRGITNHMGASEWSNHMGAPEWSNQTYLTL